MIQMICERRKKDPLVFDQDELFRPGITMEKLQNLPPAFVPKIGKVTAGNSSGINDGSAGMVILSADKAKEIGIQPLARIRGVGRGACHPAIMGLSPVPAVEDLKRRSGLEIADFELVVLRLGLNPEERQRYAADHRMFSEVHRTFRRLHPHGTWQEFVSAASRSAEGRRALAAWRRTRRMIGFTQAKAEAVRELLALHRSARVLVFTADNDAAYAVAREHLVMPITCEVSRRERERALDAFRCGELRVLVSSRVLNEGIDVPDADVAIIVGGTQGQREHVQRIGRLLRPRPGKRAVVYELVTLATAEARHAAERRRGLAAARVVST